MQRGVDLHRMNFKVQTHWSRAVAETKVSGEKANSAATTFRGSRVGAGAKWEQERPPKEKTISSNRWCCYLLDTTT